MRFIIKNGDSAIILKQYLDNHFDSIVCDPPYGIEFLQKDWDKNTGAIEVWQECLRVLKPGGYLLAFSAPRTYHRLASNLENIGFEIKDMIAWHYMSGFPKAQDVGRMIQKSTGDYKQKKITSTSNVGANHNILAKTNAGLDNAGFSGMEIICESDEAKQWEGYKTALKPAMEPIVLARKPTKLSTAKNVLEYGCGALNIDGCRIPYADEADAAEQHKVYQIYLNRNNGQSKDTFKQWNRDFIEERNKKRPSAGKRTFDPWDFEANKPKAHKSNNCFFNEDGISANATFDERHPDFDPINRQQQEYNPSDLGRYPSNVIGDFGPEYQKYFFCPKVSRKERNIGCDDLSVIDAMRESGYDVENEGTKIIGPDGLPMQRDEAYKLFRESQTTTNNHPTVKPVKLMAYLCRLVTPPNGKILDPFCGSGSTGMAAVEEGFNFVGIDLDERYCEIATKRITAWEQHGAIKPKKKLKSNQSVIVEENVFEELFERGLK